MLCGVYNVYIYVVVQPGRAFGSRRPAIWTTRMQRKVDAFAGGGGEYVAVRARGVSIGAPFVERVGF